jgi:LmbE family N-acetylglucosaminyl deacetylase
MPSGSAGRVLVIAPHADDETIGLGGTIARHVREGQEVHVAVVTGHGTSAPHPLWPPGLWDQVRAEARAACELLGVRKLLFEEIPAALVADQPAWQLNKVTGAIVEEVQPDVLYVPFPFDLHKDHREVFHSLSVAWRSSSATGRRIREIYCYETQSETHWNIPYVEAGFLPSRWVDIGDTLDTKLRAVACYKTQIREAPDARSLEGVRALAVWRGSQMGMRAAEAFVTVRTLHPSRG